jgi:hypothetical protein
MNFRHHPRCSSCDAVMGYEGARGCAEAQSCLSYVARPMDVFDILSSAYRIAKA